MKIKKILIVADDSPLSIKAIEYGFNLARDLGAKVMLLTVIEPESVAGNPDAGIFPDDALTTAKSHAADFLNRIKKRYAESVQTDLQIQTGGILSTVLKAIADYDPALVVAGTHDSSGLSGLFNANITESIIHHSPVPVLVVT